MSDNEQTLPSLGWSEVLSVKQTEGPPIPEVSQRPEDGSHIPSVVRRPKAIDVFDENPAGSELINDTHELVEESGSLASQSRTASSHREVLAGESSCDEIGPNKLPCSNVSDIVVVLHLGETVPENAPAELFLLDLPDALPPGRFQTEVEAADAGEQ